MSNPFQPYHFGPSYQSSAPSASEDHAFPVVPQRPFPHSGNSDSMQFQSSLPGIPALPRTLDLSPGGDRQKGSFNTFKGPNDFLSQMPANGLTTCEAEVSSAFNSLSKHSSNPSVGMYHPSQPTLNPMSAKPSNAVMGDPTPRLRTPSDTHVNYTVGSPSRNRDQELEDGEISTGSVSEPDHLNSGPNDPQNSLNATAGYEYQILNSQQESKRLIRQLTAWGLGIQEILAEVTESKALESLGREMGFRVDSEARASPEPQKRSPGNATSHVTQDSTPQILTTADGAVECLNAHIPTVAVVAEPSNHQHTNSDIAVTKAHGAKPMDRKALIAQKLAARNVKPSPSPSNGMPRKQDVGRVTEQSLSTKPAPLDSSGLDKESRPSPPIRPSERSQRDLEATRKFQTDLARQRMAALKQRALVKQNQPLDPAHQQSEHSHPLVLKESSNRIGDPSTNAIGLPRISTPRSPSRKGSYFSPVSQSPMFNIPGLFSLPETATKSQVPESANGRSEEPSVLTQQGPLTTAVPSEPLDKQENDTETIMPTSYFSSGLEPQNPLKRRRADDFFDSPPDRSKKSLTRADEDVVIDISDDENSLSNHSHVLGSTNGPDTMEKSFADHTDSLRRPAAEGSNSPMRAPSQAELPAALHSDGTPSGSLFAKIAESNGLKTKEMEIESMNRKIAELEANIKARKAKQAASRTQSPGGIASVTPAVVMEETLEADSNATNQVPDFTEHELGADESKMEEDSATGMETLGAPVRSVPAGISILPESLSSRFHPPQPPAVYKQPNEDLRIDQLSASVPVLGSGKQTPPEFGTNKKDAEVRNERQSVEASMPRSEVHQRKTSRRLEIESGLPILDQEIQKRREQLESIQAQEVEIQADIQRGMEGRQMLLDELSRLSNVLDSMDWKTDRASPQEIEAQIQSRSVEGDLNGSYRSVSLRTDSAQRDEHGEMQAVENDTESRPEKEPLSDVSRVSQLDPESGLPNTTSATSIDDVNEILDGDLEGENMDISRSSLDEGEIEESTSDAKGSEKQTDHEQSLNGSILDEDPFAIKTGHAEPDESTTYRQEHRSTTDVDGDLDEEDTGRGDENDSVPPSEDLEVYEPPDEPPGDPYALAPRPPAAFSKIDQHSPDVQTYQSGASPDINEPKANVQADPRNTTGAMIEDTPIDSNSEGSDDDYEPAEPSAEEIDFREKSPQSATEQVIVPRSSADTNNRDVRR